MVQTIKKGRLKNDDFQESEYTNLRGRSYPEYLISEAGFRFFPNMFDGGFLPRTTAPVLVEDLLREFNLGLFSGEPGDEIL